jgi:hypothetical protein
MPYLGDFLGHLLSEITISRSQADAEAVRLADLYASDPVLKNFPVPRFRLPNVTLRVPVAVTSMDEPTPGQPPRGTLDPAKTKAAFWRALDHQAERVELKFSRGVRDAVGKSLDRVLKSEGTELSGSVGRLAGELTSVALETLDRALVAEERPAFEKLRVHASDLREGAVAEIVRQRQPPPRLQVAVTSSELREAGPALVNLELQVSEEAVEWTIVDADGRSAPRLVPE